MQKRVAVLVALLVAACGTSPPTSSPQASGQQTVTGQVIDLGCYARNQDNVGMDHDRAYACALSCVKWEGQPVGLLAADGTVYQFAGGLVANNNALLVPHLADTVTVTGEVSERDGLLVLTADGFAD